MTARRACLGLLFASVLTASAAVAVAGDAPPRVGAVHAPAGTDARTRAQLSESLHRHLAEAGLAKSLNGYSISPALVQLRRYVEASKKIKLVCVVDLALTDAQGNIAASVRGSATSVGGSARDTLDAAAYAAVMRLPGALQALGVRKPAEQVAAR